MKFSLPLIALAAVAPAFAAPAVVEQQAAPQIAKRASRPKVIVDNDFGTTGFPPSMYLLAQGYEILGMTVVTGNSWVNQQTLHILRFLEIAGLNDTIPVYKGAVYPLINTVARSNAWQSIYGALSWAGAFAPASNTSDAAGGDPTSGDPFRTTAIPEGIPTTKPASGNAAQFMVDMVKKYPGEVEIYAAGGATNVALAIRMDPQFAENVKKIVWQGGYVDVDLFRTNPVNKLTFDNDDVGSDFNTFIDPESAKIMLNAPFKEMIICGQVANGVILTEDVIEDVLKVNTSVTNQLVAPFWNSSSLLTPLWDELAAGLLSTPDIITSNRSVYMDVDIAWAGPFYGRTFIASSPYQGAGLQKVNMVLEVNQTLFKERLVAAMQIDWTKKNYTA